MCDHPVFVYGTLKKGQPNYYVMEDLENGVAKFLGRGHTVDSYPLVIASLYNIPFALSYKGTGKNIQGEIYHVDQKMLSTLDRFEECRSCNSLYIREFHEVRLTEDSSKRPQNTTVQCWVYFLENFKPELLKLPYIEDYDSWGDHGMPYKEGDADVRSAVMLV